MFPYRIVISDACQLFREGISRLLERYNLAPVWSGRTLAEALAGCHTSEPPDVAICGLDADTPLEAWLAELAQARAGLSLRVVVLAQPGDRRPAELARAGIDALLSKDISGEVLQRSLELVMLGQQLFPAFAVAIADTEADPPPAEDRAPTDAAHPAMDLRALYLGPNRNRSGIGENVPLSDREQQILRYLVGGSPNKLIGRSLGITEATVKVHIKGLLRKLNAANRTQAAIWAMSHGRSLEPETIDLAPRPVLAQLNGR